MNTSPDTFLYRWFGWPFKRFAALRRGAQAVALSPATTPAAHAHDASPESLETAPLPALERVAPVTRAVKETLTFMRHAKKRDAADGSVLTSRTASARESDVRRASATKGEPAAQGALVVAPDPAVEALQAKIAGVEAMLADLVARHEDMQQTVQDFQLQQYSALGDCVAECLWLRHEYARLRAERSGAAADAEKARQAGAERDDYANARASAPQTRPELDDETRGELKRLYRSVAMRCHPDRVGIADKAQAHERFQRAQRAYRDNDIASLYALLQEIDTRSPAARKTAETPSAAALTRALSAMRNAAADLMLAIQTLQLDADYRRALRRDEWAETFEMARKGFAAECEALRAKIDAMVVG